MKNFIQPGKVITHTAAAALISGQAIKIGTLGIGVCTTDIANGAQGELGIEGVFYLPKEAPLVIAAYDRLYWDDTAKVLTKTAMSNTLCGFAVAAALSADTKVYVKLVPMGA